MSRSPAAEFSRMKLRLSVNIVALRHDRGLSQAQLARKLWLKQQYISDLERGKRNPTLRTLAGLACAVDVQTHALIHSRKRVHVTD